MSIKQIIQKVKQTAKETEVQPPTPPKVSAPSPSKVPKVKLPQISPIFTAKVI